jgi:hypothetical protein
LALGVDPEAVVGDAVLGGAAPIQGLQVAQDIGIGDDVKIAPEKLGASLGRDEPEMSTPMCTDQVWKTL